MAEYQQYTKVKVTAVLVQRVANIDLCVYEEPAKAITLLQFYTGRRCRSFRPTPPGWLLVHGDSIYYTSTWM